MKTKIMKNTAAASKVSMGCPIHQKYKPNKTKRLVSTDFCFPETVNVGRSFDSHSKSTLLNSNFEGIFARSCSRTCCSVFLEFPSFPELAILDYTVK